MEKFERSVVVSAEDNNKRAEKFILHHFRDIVISKELCRQCFKRGEILVNNSPIETSRILHKDAIVQVSIDQSEIKRSRLNLSITVKYEDHHLAVVLKPPGVHMRGLQESLPFLLDSSRSIASETPYLCINQLQRSMNGLVILSKSREMHEKLLSMDKSGDIKFRYRLVCHGKFDESAKTAASNCEESIDNDNNDVIHGQKSIVVDNDNNAINNTKSSSTINNRETDVDNNSATTIIRHASLQLPFAIHPISTTRSTSGEGNYLTTLDIIHHNHAQVSLSAIKDYFMRIKHPIVGHNTASKQLKSCKDKGILMALVEVAFEHPVTRENVCVECDEPRKLKTICQREQNFYEKKRAARIAEAKLYGIENAVVLNDNLEMQSGLPLAYIAGEKSFCGLQFMVSNQTMIPRASTEHLVRATLDIYKTQILSNKVADNITKSFRILDVGTGSGCILIAIMHSILSLSEYDTTDAGIFGMGIDISPLALDVAKNNAKRHLHKQQSLYCFAKGNMEYLHNDPLLSQKNFDVIVCNPPYLDITKPLPPSDPRSHEPSHAIYCSEEGYKCYRLLSKSLDKSLALGSQVLNERGFVVLEVGASMAKKVKGIFNDWCCVKSIKDQQGFERCLVFRRK
ncbi:9585_t:CDS:2 [Paraglomus occultum]|uniref:9585_t:CDS:1 n=1 Tax=Paraglomus occultum TaxID=144539 RepID=A0A9N8ZPC9_9GLOM|nr:9585_t:CDS:2 [Paraglomus occultum]